MKKIYVCVLSTDNYLNGVLVLNKNLKYLKSKYKLLCLINENISDYSKKVLDYFNIKYKLMDSIKYDTMDSISKHWIYTFDKLNVFNLTEYDKVVYLDSDLLILENIDYLFKEKALSMPRDLPFNYKEFNSGVMVLEPNKNDYQLLKKLALKSDEEERKISDQNIINEYFKDKINPLAYGYNMVREIKSSIKPIYDVKTEKLEKKHPMIYFLESSEYNKIIHYIGKLKPFMIDELKEGYVDEYNDLYGYYLETILRKKHIFEIDNINSLVSIIVPIYNDEKNIDKCLDSISCQTYRNLEIIIVNDGSTDDSLKLCKLYQKYDKRIKIINEEHSGVSSARNKGLEKATGEYICFVDSDDMLEITMIERLLLNMKKYNLDFVQCGTIINDDKVKYCDEEEVLGVNQKELIKDFLNENISSTVWDKMYKKELLEGLKFREEYKKNEDGFFVFEVLKKTKTFMRVGLPLYKYYYKQDNHLTGNFSLKDDYNLFAYLDEITDYINKEYLEYKSILNIKVFNILNYMFNSLEALDEIEPVDRNSIFVQELIKRFNDLEGDK